MKFESVADYARQYLVKAIIAGQLQPGQQVKEEEIASRLGISRPPLREAFKSLEAEGLVTRKPRRGVFVSEVAERDVWEIYTLKTALYGLATALAVERINDRDLARLDRIVEKMEGCLGRDLPDVERYQDLHEDFHGLLMDVAGHERLRRIASSLHTQVKRFSSLSLANKDHLKRSCGFHRQILAAIRNRDKERAEELTRKHVQGALAFLQRLCAEDASPDVPRPREEAQNHLRKSRGSSRTQREGASDDERPLRTASHSARERR